MSSPIRSARARDFTAACRVVLAQLRAVADVQTVMIVGRSGAGAAVQRVDDTGYGLRIGDVLDDPDRSYERPLVENRSHRLGTTRGRSMVVGCRIVVPMPFGTGSARSLVVLDPVSRRDLHRVEELTLAHADLLATALELERRTLEAETLAHTDELTGLANRRSWKDTLEREEARCARHGLHGAIAVVDLNNLKIINDSAGHFVGDDHLRSAAAALESCLRASDFVARLGGDEFGLLLTQTRDISADQVSSLISRRLNERGIDAAVGAATRAEHGTLHAAWPAADLAMYSRKVAQRSQPQTR